MFVTFWQVSYILLGSGVPENQSEKLSHIQIRTLKKAPFLPLKIIPLTGRKDRYNTIRQ
jgi:hypothetical protein